MKNWKILVYTLSAYERIVLLDFIHRLVSQKIEGILDVCIEKKKKKHPQKKTKNKK